jgi:hypothetical protein
MVASVFPVSVVGTEEGEGGEEGLQHACSQDVDAEATATEAEVSTCVGVLH